MNVYRVVYIHRPAPDAMTVDKIMLVAADTDALAVNYVNSIKGNEVTSASTHCQDIKMATPAVPPARVTVPPANLPASVKPTPVPPATVK